MKKLLIFVCTLMIGTAAFAAPAKHAPPVARLSGTVEKFDTATRTLTVKHDGGKQTTFLLNDQSQVMNGKTTADASALAASTGHAVKVDYKMDGATRVAEKIDVVPARATVKKK